MMLRKDKWLNLDFQEAIDFQEGPGILAKDFRNKGVPLIRLAGMDDGISLLNGCNYLDEELVTRKYEHFRIKKGDIILSTSATLGKTSFVEEEAVGAIVYTGLVRMRPKNDNVYAPFIKYLLQSPKFIQQIESMGVGSVMKHFGPTHLKKISITLPSFDEQKTISELFPALEMAMEHVEEQEKNLKALKKSLVNGLLNKEPVFGNLLNRKNCRATTFGEIAECDKKYPEHEKEVERFVGLEWIEADNFQLQGFGLVADGTTFSKRFAIGDVLFGKRRAYLKKVAVADFDGICSGDILVIRGKDKKILQGLLPYYISADAFIQHAVSTSAGSLSPRTKWKDLANLEVSIPDLKTQSVILEVLQQLDTTVNQLKQQKMTLKNLKQKLLNEILG